MVDSYDEDEFDFGTLPEVQQQEFLYDLIGFTSTAQDSEVRDMFFSLMYDNELSMNDRIEQYERLSEYLEQEYGMDFSEIWDWEDFRAWYDAQ